MYIVAFIVINLVSALLLRVHSRYRTNLYFSGYLTAMSLGFMAHTLDPNPIAHAVEQIVPLELTARFLSAISYRFSPYFFILAGYSLTGPTKEDLRKHSYFFAIPMILEYLYGFFVPQESFVYVYPDYSASFGFLAVWGTLYALAANILVYYAFFKETDQRIRLQKLFISILTLPTMLVTYHAYVMPALGHHDFTHFTAGLGIFIFLAVLFFAARHGFMGIRLVIGKDFLESSIKSVTLGTAMLNHAIKNEVQVINACVENAQTMELPLDARRSLATITMSTQRLMEVVSRIQDQTQDNLPIKSSCDIHSIIQYILETQDSIFQRKGIIVDYQPISDITIHGDPINIREVIQNLVSNAVEAMNHGGKLNIETAIVRRNIKIKITDTGAGISREHLSRVFEPFFTTKRFGVHYGLGLSYCFKVMQQHRGNLEIQSEVGKGTTVTLTFPMTAKRSSGMGSRTSIARN